MKSIKNYISKASHLKLMSDALFIFAIAISSYTLWSTYKAKSIGICPFSISQWLYYISIALLIISLIFTFIEKQRK